MIHYAEKYTSTVIATEIPKFGIFGCVSVNSLHLSPSSLNSLHALNPRHKNNPVIIRSFELSLAAVNYCSILEKEGKFVISRQLLKCSTSVAANIREAQNAESRADFIHKLKLAAKELEETEYWLDLCSQAHGYPDPSMVSESMESVRRLLFKILSSSIQNNKLFRH
jgi:four helix bundle protein